MTIQVETWRERSQRRVTPEDVLETYSVFQPKTARMVARELGIDPGDAVRLLTRLEMRGELVKARGGTETPVWLRPPQPRPPRVPR
jgi:CRP-like cAMP-binding protein